MLVIENYKKLIGLKFGEWHCGLAEEHDPLYRFHFREGEYTKPRMEKDILDRSETKRIYGCGRRIE